MGANVAGVAIGELGVQPPFAVAIQAYGHGADDLARDRVEPVAYLSVAIAAQYPACGTFPDSVDHPAVGGTQMVLRDLVWEIAVAEKTILRMGLAEVLNQALMSSLFVGHVGRAAVAGDTAQVAVRCVHRVWFDVKVLRVLR